MLRRLVSPTGFVLVAIFFLLPFLTVRCAPVDPDATVAPTATFTGVDLVVGGEPDLLLPERQPGDVYRLKRADPATALGRDVGLPAEPFAGAAVVLIVIGVVAAAIRPVWLRGWTAGVAALLAGLAVLAAVLRSRNRVAGMLAELWPDSDQDWDRYQFITLGLGAWLAMAGLAALGLGNVFVAVPRRAVDNHESNR